MKWDDGNNAWDKNEVLKSIMILIASKGHTQTSIVLYHMDFEMDCYELLTWLNKWLDKPFFCVYAVLLSTFILLFLPSSCVSLSFFNLAVPMHKCLLEHSWASSHPLMGEDAPQLLVMVVNLVVSSIIESKLDCRDEEFFDFWNFIIIAKQQQPYLEYQHFLLISQHSADFISKLRIL